MTAEEKRKYHHGNLRQALVQAGMEIIETDGLDALSLRSLATKVGVSHTASRNHFGSMKGLITAIGTEGFRIFAREMRAGLDAASTREATLTAAMEGYVRFATAHPELFRIMFSPDYCDYKDDALLEAARGSYGVLREISVGLEWDKAEAANGQWRTEMMLWSFVHGYATLQNAGQFFDEHGNVPPTITDVMPTFGYQKTEPR